MKTDGENQTDSQEIDGPSSAEGRGRDHLAYWKANLRVMAVLLAVWFFASFGLGILFVEPLNAFSIGGFPLGFWFSQQGSIYIFVALIFVYARWMDRIDASFGVD